MSLPLVLALLSASDLATTLFGMWHGYEEVMPAARWAIATAGIPGLVALSVGGTGFQLAVLRWWPMPRRARLFAWAMVLTLAFVPPAANLARLCVI